MLALVLANGNWAYCGTGHDHLRAMGLELIIWVKTIGCADVGCIGATDIQDISL